MILPAVIILCMLAVMSACSREPVAAVTDSIRYQAGDMMQWSAMEDGIFYKNSDDHLVHFVSADTHEDIVFCANPVCKHEAASESNPDPECRAALFEEKAYIAYYEGCIYYFVNNGIFEHKLYKMDLSSGVRELIGEYPYKYSPLWYVFYEDCLYYNARIIEEKGRTTSSRAVMLEVNIKDGSCRTIVERDVESTYVASRMDVRDNIMFAVMKGEVNDYIATVNLDTLEETTILEYDNVEFFRYKNIRDRDSFYYMTMKELGIYYIDTGEREVLIEAVGDGTVGGMITNQGIWYKRWDGKEETPFFYDFASGDTWDMTKKCEELKSQGMRVSALEKNQFVMLVYEETEKSGSNKVLGYSTCRIKDFLEGCRKVK